MSSLHIGMDGPKPRFDNLTECLNTNWTIQIPHINLTSSEENVREMERALQEQEGVHLRTYAYKYSSHGDFLFYAWNTALSICLAVILFRGRLPPAVLAATDIVHAASEGASWTHEALLGLIATTLLLFIGAIVARILWRWNGPRRKRQNDNEEGGQANGRRESQSSGQIEMETLKITISRDQLNRVVEEQRRLRDTEE